MIILLISIGSVTGYSQNSHDTVNNTFTLEIPIVRFYVDIEVNYNNLLKKYNLKVEQNKELLKLNSALRYRVNLLESKSNLYKSINFNFKELLMLSNQMGLGYKKLNNVGENSMYALQLQVNKHKIRAWYYKGGIVIGVTVIAILVRELILNKNN